ncbi:MAG: gamma carbonic anhydrase family protein, partial [Bacteroidia bacterium]
MDTAERISQEPQLAASVFIAPGAHVMGTVRIGDNSSVWYNAVLRGDTEQITVGCRSNIQDGAIVHAAPGDAAIIGGDCVIGHGAIVPGA